MNKNLDIIAEELFNKIRTQFPGVKLGDESSKVTNEPAKARFFEFDFKSGNHPLGRMTVSISEDDGLVAIYSNNLIEDADDLSKKQFFNFLKELREFAKQRFLNFDTRDITKSNLEKRDYEQMSTNFGEGKMTESKLFGTSKTSYQDIGEAKLIVKHSSPVNDINPAGRTQRIENIYIENSVGERFRYPFKHLNGARALAQHVSHGGTPYDNIGQHVIGLSEELSKLRMFKNYVERNPVISETMGSINTKVIERIDQVKKEIHSLQHPAKYQEFAESFEGSQIAELPEDVVNDWVDRLTIRSFNEELKNVFPYIFKLVDESDIPVKDLSVEDLISEAKCDICGMDPCDCDHSKDNEVKEFAQYEKMLDSIIGEGDDIFSNKPENQKAAIAKLNKLIATPLPVGIDGDNATESLNDIIKDDELMDIFKELADISPEQDVRPVLKDYIKIKDEENGTDVLSQLNFEGEPGMDGDGNASAAEEPPVEEPAAEEPPAEAPAEEPVTASIEREGNAFAQAVQKAKAAGMKPGDKFKVGDKEMTLKDAIVRAGYTVEDFFNDKQKSQINDIVEFVKSMYDSNTGNFPKGETGVMIAVEKKFGDHARPIAEKIIGKLSAMNETQRMLKLAGVQVNSIAGL